MASRRGAERVSGERAIDERRRERTVEMTRALNGNSRGKGNDDYVQQCATHGKGEREVQRSVPSMGALPTVDAKSKVIIAFTAKSQGCNASERPFCHECVAQLSGSVWL